jgi:hypothetical protein
MQQLARSKSLAPHALIGMFIFHPVTIKTFARYVAALDFQQQPRESIPDFVCGLGKFYAEKSNVIADDGASHSAELDRPTHVGYLQHIYAVSDGRERDYTFEVFFYRLYQHIELEINRVLKHGIDNVWDVSGQEVKPHGRVRYASVHLASVKLLGIVRRADSGGGSA